eukprot:1714196-Rhodomonas_salina.1
MAEQTQGSRAKSTRDEAEEHQGREHVEDAACVSHATSAPSITQRNTDMMRTARRTKHRPARQSHHALDTSARHQHRITSHLHFTPRPVQGQAPLCLRAWKLGKRREARLRCRWSRCRGG